MQTLPIDNQLRILKYINDDKDLLTLFTIGFHKHFVIKKMKNKPFRKLHKELLTSLKKCSSCSEPVKFNSKMEIINLRDRFFMYTDWHSIIYCEDCLNNGNIAKSFADMVKSSNDPLFGIVYLKFLETNEDNLTIEEKEKFIKDYQKEVLGEEAFNRLESLNDQERENLANEVKNICQMQ